MNHSRKILTNLFSLSVAEFASKGLTAIFIVYLANILEPASYGIITFSKSFVMPFVLICNLGLEIFGTREIAKNKDSKSYWVNQIFSLRLALSIISFTLLLIVTFFLDKTIEAKIILVIAGTNIFSLSLLLNWFYYGIEEMGIIAKRQIAVAVLNLIGIFVFINGPDDAIIAMIIMSSSLILTGLWLFVDYTKKYGQIKIAINIRLWFDILKNSVPIGITQFLVLFYNSIGIILLGFLRSDDETGIFGAAYQIMVLAVLPSTLIQTALFPRISKLNSFEERKRIIDKYAVFITIVGVSIVSMTYTHADFIISILNDKYSNSADVLRLLMISNAFVYITIIYVSSLIAWKYEKLVIAANLSGLVINVIANLLLIPKYGPEGVAIATILSEFTVLIVIMGLYINKIKTSHLKGILKVVGVGFVSFVPGLYMNHLDIYPMITMVLTFCIFVCLLIALKILNINELKSYFAK